MECLPLPNELAAKFIVSEALPGDYLHSTWPSWSKEQRKIFLRDFADLFIGLANCGIPQSLRKRDMWHQISDTTHDSYSLLAKEISDRSSGDPTYMNEMLQMLDALIAIHPNPTSASLHRLVIDQNDHQPAGGDVLVDTASGHLTGLIGKFRFSYRKFY